MTYPLVLRGLAEEIQAFISANSGLGYVSEPPGVNFTVEEAADWQGLERLAGSQILLTLFDEGGTLSASGRRTTQERSFRFAAKGASGQEALDRAHDLMSWVWNQKCFATPNFKAWVLRSLRLPQVALRGASGSYVADFVVTFGAMNNP